MYLCLWLCVLNFALTKQKNNTKQKQNEQKKQKKHTTVDSFKFVGADFRGV